MSCIMITCGQWCVMTTFSIIKTTWIYLVAFMLTFSKCSMWYIYISLETLLNFSVSREDGYLGLSEKLNISGMDWLEDHSIHWLSISDIQFRHYTHIHIHIHTYIYIYIYMHTYIYIYPRLHLCECSVQCEECVCICIIMFKELPFPWIVYPHCWLILPCMRFSWLFHVTFINIYESNILSVCMDIYMHIHIEGLVFQITHLHCLETITSLFYLILKVQLFLMWTSKSLDCS